MQMLVDFMRVSPSGDPESALVSIDGRTPRDVHCDVLVVGGGTAGVSAALAAARHGSKVCLLEETDWLGGQLTSQGVSALDEHPFIEDFGGTATYYRLRRALREHYRRLAGVQHGGAFNPGNCWVTNLAFEPRVAAEHLASLVREQGNVAVHLRVKAASATVENDRIVAVLAASLTSDQAWRFIPRIVVDATELGDLLPLVGASYRVGAEAASETGEPHAQPKRPRPECVQSFTYPFALERRPRVERNIIPRPPEYERFRTRQPYSLQIEVHGGEIYSETSGRLGFRIFETAPGTKGGLWQYRRLIDAAQFPDSGSNDISMFNWPGNDYRDGSLIDRSPIEIATTLQQAKRVSLGFLYWLQTEAPAESDRIGAPELKLRPDVMGTDDGLSKFPYIRESRRIVALKTILEQELSVACLSGPRAAHFPDSVGIGWYPIDIHPVAGDVGISCRTHPFQIPLGALIPIRLTNLIAGGKNIGTTHISNGCYRLHPVEWNVGESAGVLAAFTLRNDTTPAQVRSNAELLGALQTTLLKDGVPLAWITDVPVGDPAFPSVQANYMADPRPFENALTCRSNRSNGTSG